MRIVGVSPLHDSTVAVINDGKLELFFKEERYTRAKRDSYPIKSLLNVLKNVKGPIDHCCVAGGTGPEMQVLSTTLQKMFNCPVTDYHRFHHLSHASLAFYNSGFETALVVVIDRDGSIINENSREAETVFEASYPNNFKTLYQNTWKFNDSFMSIVKVYESATTLIGQKPLENGKTMGLAAYGNDKSFVEFFKNNNPVHDLFDQGRYVLEHFDTTIYKDYIPNCTKDITKENYQFYADYAYQVQKQTQEQVLDLIKNWVNTTGISKVCLTGGYGLNVVCNEYLVKNLPEVEFYFEPLADDSGNSIGAAMHLYRMLTNDTTISSLNNTFVHGVTEDYDVIGTQCNYNDIVKELIEQKSVGVYNGLAESGPRALGNRSILFDPRNPQAKDIVNKIKNREWYRPFAAMILEEDFQDYFETHGLQKSEHMTISFQCKLPDVIPGVVHVDGSCRIQTVNNTVPHIYNLLTEFKKQTGCPVLLNTSFNLAGEPLVETVGDAINTYDQSELSVLWFPELGKCIK